MTTVMKMAVTLQPSRTKYYFHLDGPNGPVQDDSGDGGGAMVSSASTTDRSKDAGDAEEPFDVEFAGDCDPGVSVDNDDHRSTSGTLCCEELFQFSLDNGSKGTVCRCAASCSWPGRINNSNASKSVDMPANPFSGGACSHAWRASQRALRKAHRSALIT